MAILVRWVHPYKVKKDGTLKPSAFRDSDVISALTGPNEQGCDKRAISLADFSLLTDENKDHAKKPLASIVQYLGSHERSGRVARIVIVPMVQSEHAEHLSREKIWKVCFVMSMG